MTFFHILEYVFLYSRSFCFSSLVGFCTVHNHIAAFFPSLKNFNIFQELSFVVFLYYFDVQKYIKIIRRHKNTASQFYNLHHS